MARVLNIRAHHAQHEQKCSCRALGSCLQADWVWPTLQQPLRSATGTQLSAARAHGQGGNGCRIEAGSCCLRCTGHVFVCACHTTTHRAPRNTGRPAVCLVDWHKQFSKADQMPGSCTMVGLRTTIRALAVLLAGMAGRGSAELSVCTPEGFANSGNGSPAACSPAISRAPP